MEKYCDSYYTERLNDIFDDTDGYFEVFKNKSNEDKKREYVSYKFPIGHYGKKSDLGDSNIILFCVFLCLMMRYTQNESLNGILIRIVNKEISIIGKNISYDNDLTFAELVKLINNANVLFNIKEDVLHDVLKRTSRYTGCLFVYTDSPEFTMNFDDNDDISELFFQVIDDHGCIEVDITYNKYVFNKDFICRMVTHYKNFLSWVLLNPETPIYKAQYLDETEKNMLLDVWNSTECPFPKGRCIHQLFEERVVESPNKVAVYYEGKQMSRATLNKYSNQLAHYLIELGVKKGDIVAIYSNKSINFIIGVLGVLKAGCAYLPIDSSYPKSRVQHIINNSKASVAIVTTNWDTICELMTGIKVINMGVDNNIFNDYPDYNPDVTMTSFEPCYLIYTSGSTGEPKGVLLNHEGRVNNFYDFNSRFSITSNDKLLAVSSISFDMTAYDVLGSLIGGSSIVLPDPLLEKQPFHWLDLINKYQVTVWHSVPVMLELICKCSHHRKNMNIESIRLILLGGDWIPLSIFNQIRLLNRNAQLVGLGGVTEVSMDSTTYTIEYVDSKWKSIPYGKPMNNQKAYILDKNMQLMPIGIPGEMYIGGIGVADGYYLNPQATKERFFQNPWIDDSKQRIYKTGDLALIQSDGNLILLGRIDFQVKINGTRIELGEIEHCLSEYEGVNKVVAIAPKVGTNRKIVLYIEYKTSHSIPNEREIISFLKRYLPKSHIPSYIMFTSELPVTPNGKIDRKMLENKMYDLLNKPNCQ